MSRLVLHIMKISREIEKFLFLLKIRESSNLANFQCATENEVKWSK